MVICVLMLRYLNNRRDNDLSPRVNLVNVRLNLKPSLSVNHHFDGRFELKKKFNKYSYLKNWVEIIIILFFSL